MPYRRIFFEKNQPVHIFSHAVEGRKIFDDDADCCRFIFQIYAANMGKPVPNLWRKDTMKVAQALLHGEEIPSRFIVIEHSPFVHILDFSLVVNHYHFYLVPNIENGVPLFMQKLNMGFAKYFNPKHNRKGALFGSRYKGIPIETEFQSDAVSRYIGIINPLDVYQPGWRKKGLKNQEEAFEFLKTYQFSSFPDRIGERKSKILAPKAILERYLINSNFEGKKEYEKFVKDFLSQNLGVPGEIFLE